MLFTSLCILSASAQKVSNSIARQTAESFWSKSLNNNYTLAQLTSVKTENSDTTLFIYNIGNEGFVVVSGDYSSNPVLGYSTEGNYNNNQAPAFKNWIGNYSKAIASEKVNAKLNSEWNQFLSNSQLPVKQSSKAVTPLCTTKWDQGKYYNHNCPVYSTGPDGHCVTGCVATAMAQIMKYYNWPPQGIGSHSYPHPYFGTIGADFSATTYDWANMGTYGNLTTEDAISTLIFDCGVSVNMDYTPIESGANTADVATALVNYFHYRNTIAVIDKSNYDDHDWIALLKDNIDQNHPILYSGSGSGGGHAWVCDGYDANNKFHMNWGWSGSNNGYYQVDTLNAGGYDFSSDEEIVANIVPYFAPYCMASRTFTDSTGTVSDGSGYSYYWNNTNCDWLIEPDSAERVVLEFSDFNTESGKDIVSIYDGSTTSGTLLGTFSGTDIPPVLTSTSGKMLITFSSDSLNQGLGWSAKYWALKHGDGIKENELGKVSVYPNPATNSLYLLNHVSVSEPVNISIYDYSGKVVYSASQSFEKNNITTIDLSNFDSGFYIISFQSAQYNYRSKFIKQ